MNTRIRYNLIIVLLAILMLALLCTCEQPPTEVTAKYVAAEGGHIFGITEQIVPYGEDAKRVIAYADDGYIFTGWSDGVVESERLDANLRSDILVTAEFAEILHNVTYSAAENGHIEGQAAQTVRHGTSTTKVTAIADANYMFVKWSDGKTDPERSDTYVRGDIEVTAIFDNLQRTFTYNYNNDTDFYSKQNNTEKRVVVKINTMGETQLVVPIREHFAFDGWYLDDQFTTRVTNENGEIVIDKSLFAAESTNLYAKWNNITEPPVYKILMVYVTEVHAIFLSNKNPERVDIPIQVDFVMSDVERHFCEQLTGKFQDWLNDTFDGLVIFDVDDYFTTVPIGNELFYMGMEGIRDEDGTRCQSLLAQIIPEVRHLHPKYRSVLTTLCLNDYDALLRNAEGQAGRKFGMVYLEASLRRLKEINYPLSVALETGMVNENDFWRHYVLRTYIHEFIHTAEFWSDYDSALMIGKRLHEAIELFSYNTNDDLLVLSQYLLKTLGSEDNKVGIPYEFWGNENYNY